MVALSPVHCVWNRAALITLGIGLGIVFSDAGVGRAYTRKSMIQSVRAPKTAELIAIQLRRRIARRELSEGDALPPESQLMDQFGVSRPILREAFRILESESLIEVRRGVRGGARVRLPDPRTVARYTALLLQLKGTTLGDVLDARR